MFEQYETTGFTFIADEDTDEPNPRWRSEPASGELDVTRDLRGDLWAQHRCFFQMLVDEALDVITVLDEAGTVVFKNRSGDERLGYAPGELIGSNVFDFVHPDDLSRVRGAFGDALTNAGSSHLVEHRIRHRNGSWRTFESAGRWIHGMPGGALAIVNSRDITERKALEAQMSQGQKLEAIGLMTSTIAHDFNNLLLVISAFAELLENGRSASVQHHAAEIQKVIANATKLTRQLLAFARPAQADQPGSVEANQTIVDLKSILGRLVGHSTVVNWRLDASDAHVALGRGSLEQILINLAVNARDAMPNGGVLTLATRNESPPPVGDEPEPVWRGEYLLIEVADTGVGMTDDVKARIFEPFFTTKTPGRGTGLGLSTVVTIVQQAHGRIDVLTEAGQGTTVRLYLPVTPSP